MLFVLTILFIFTSAQACTVDNVVPETFRFRCVDGVRFARRDGIGSSDGTSSILDNLEKNGGTAAGVVIGNVILPKKTTNAAVKAVGGSVPDHKD